MIASGFVALCLPSMVLYSRAWEIDGTHCPQDQSPILDSSLDVVDYEVPATILLQNHMQKPSFRQESLATPTKVLVLMISCHANSHQWDTLRDWSRQVHPEGRALILSGRAHERTALPWPYEDKPFHHDASSQLLVVNASDAYEGLPGRMLMAFHSILLEPELADITHVLKLDDTTILGKSDSSQPVGMNVTKVETSLSKVPADYLSSEFGYRAYDCAALPANAMRWHLTHKLANASYWNNRSQPCDGIFTYADGEFGYILSRRALKVLAEAWPLDSMDSLYQQYVYEDMMIGRTLRNYSVTLYPIKLQGMPQWSRLNCPCSPSNPDARCENFCVHSERRCCWSACGYHLDLCQSVIEA